MSRIIHWNAFSWICFMENEKSLNKLNGFLWKACLTFVKFYAFTKDWLVLSIFATYLVSQFMKIPASTSINNPSIICSWKGVHTLKSFKISKLPFRQTKIKRIIRMEMCIFLFLSEVTCTEIVLLLFCMRIRKFEIFKLWSEPEWTRKVFRSSCARKCQELFVLTTVTKEVHESGVSCLHIRSHRFCVGGACAHGICSAFSLNFGIIPREVIKSTQGKLKFYWRHYNAIWALSHSLQLNKNVFRAKLSGSRYCGKSLKTFRLNENRCSSRPTNFPADEGKQNREEDNFSAAWIFHLSDLFTIFHAYEENIHPRSHARTTKVIFTENTDMFMAYVCDVPFDTEKRFTKNHVPDGIQMRNWGERKTLQIYRHSLY